MGRHTIAFIIDFAYKPVYFLSACDW